MEDHHFAQQILLSMNISCCETCPATLKRSLLSMPGVESFSIVMEKDLVIVTGTVDPMTLLNMVSRLGKKVKLLPNHGERRYQESQCGGALPHEEKEEAHPQPQPHRCEPYNPPLKEEVERASRVFFGRLHHQRSHGSFSGDFGTYMDPFDYNGCHRPRPFSFDFISSRSPF